jgi:predicted HAD superfamily phosphohydrolase
VIVLLALDLVAGVILAYLAAVLVLAYDSCLLQECSYEGFTAGWLLALIGPVLLLVVAGIAAIVRVVRHKRAWWIPLVGLAAAVAVWLAGAQIVFQAVPGSSF